MSPIRVLGYTWAPPPAAGKALTVAANAPDSISGRVNYVINGDRVTSTPLTRLLSRSPRVCVSLEQRHACDIADAPVAVDYERR